MWIEIHIVDWSSSWNTVTSFAEVWIEISSSFHWLIFLLSLPSRKCGLKLRLPANVWRYALVTSFAEVWIEIINGSREKLQQRVTSFAEVWIEIPTFNSSWCLFKSLPSRKCGLKYPEHKSYLDPLDVTSFAEVWIEIVNGYGLYSPPGVTSFAEVWIEIC